MRILVERSNVHYRLFQTLVYMYMQSVTLIPRYFIIIWKLSQEKSFNEFIYNTLSKRQIVIHQRAFIYDKLSFCFLFAPSEKFKINTGTVATGASREHC